MSQDVIIRIFESLPRPIRHVFPYTEEWFLQFTKFVIVGVSSSLMNLAILYTLTEFFSVYYLYSAAIALFLSAINGYTLNNLWTFKAPRHKNHRLNFSKYLVLNVITYTLNLAVLASLVESFGFWYIFAEIIAILIALVGNFIGSKYWVFK